MSKIILASSSPRRKALLSKYDLDIDVIPSHIDEKVFQGETSEQVAMSLAFEKALSVVAKLSDNEIVIGSDTIVYMGRTVLGKPKDEKEAISMLKMLSGREHLVVTGIAVLKANTNIKIIDFEKTIVKFRDLTEEKIMKYIKTGEYKDKAGAYAIQGYGEVFIEKIYGCYSNVVGLPVAKLDELLEKNFNISLL